MKFIPRLFTGIQPTGSITLGNYLGAICPWVQLTEQFNTEGKRDRCLFMIADLHALTTISKKDNIHENVHLIVASLLASGIDPLKATIFQQSQVRGHTELAWILQCMTPMGWLDRMTQFKAKTQNNIIPNLGLYSYPTLMAADILLYQASHVPVGKDQIQHLEFTCDLVKKINNYLEKKLFVKPMVILPPRSLSKIKSLQDGNKKMSKSDNRKNASIFMNHSQEDIEKIVRSAKTDSLGSIQLIDISKDRMRRPELFNLLSILAELKSKTISDVYTIYDGLPISNLKDDLTTELINLINPFRNKVFDYLNHPDSIQQILQDGQEISNEIAYHTLQDVKQAFHLE